MEDPQDTRALLEWDSLDYTPIYNAFSEQQERSRYSSRKRILGYSGVTFARWLLTLVLGVSMGGIAFCVARAASAVAEERARLVESALLAGVFPRHVVFGCVAAANMALAAVACGSVLLLSEQAAASGIPDVKAYLNGVRIPRLLDLRCLCAKLIGTVAAVSSGLVVGPEGPLVHMGAALGLQLTRLHRAPLPESWGWWQSARHRLAFFRSDMEQRDFVSIGAASGFAAAFGAPVGGILFAMEEVSSFWSSKLLWRALSATALATLTLSVVAPTSDDELADFGLVSLATEPGSRQKNKLVELLPFALMGAAGGALGALCNHSWHRLPASPFTRWLRPPRPARAHWRAHLKAVCALSLLTTSAAFWLPLLVPGVCAPIDAPAAPVAPDAAPDVTTGPGLLRFGCAEGEHNELALFTFGSREDAIKQLLNGGRSTTHPATLSAPALAVVFIVFPVLMVLTFGAALPAGIFMPTIAAGASGGALLGDGLVRAFGADALPSAGTFALIGAVSLLGGIQRSSVSLVVIILEGTGEVQFVLPIILATVCARSVGDLFSHGVYEVGLEQKGLPFLEAPSARVLIGRRVRDVMGGAGAVRTLPPRPTLRRTLVLLRACSHCGFPVVDAGGRLQGLVLRAQLRAAATLLRQRHGPLRAGGGGVSPGNGAGSGGRFAVPRGSAAPPAAAVEGTPGHGRFPSWFERDIHVPHCSVEVEMEADEGVSAHAGARVGVGVVVGAGAGAGGAAERGAPALDVQVRAEKGEGAVTDAKEEGGADRERANTARASGGAADVAVVVETEASTAFDAESVEVDVSAIMTRGVHVVHADAPLAHAFAMFCSLGLRHIVALSRDGVPLGMITRADLLAASRDDRHA
eukprot:g1011.t1